MKSMMLNGIGFVTGEPTLKLSYPSVTHPTLQVKATASGDLKWIYLMLPLHKGDVITGINITYKNSAATSFISQVRLAEYANAIGAMVRHDDGTDLLTTVATVRNSVVANVPVNGSIVLCLRLNFGNVNDMIEIGMVEVVYQ